MKKRIFFSILWSILSVVGIIMCLITQSFSEPISLTMYYITGFHVPQNAIYFTVLFGLFADYPEISFLCILLFFLFIVFWIISIIKLKCSKMFEWLICFDRIISLSMLSVVAIIQNNEFTGWYLFIIPIIENFIIIAIFISKRKGKGNTGDGSPVTSN